MGTLVTSAAGGNSTTTEFADAKGVAQTAAAVTRSTSPAAVVPVTKEQRIEMMLKETGFEEDEDDEGEELSFEELLEQEKAFFKAQGEKMSIPRTSGKDNAGKTKVK